MGESHVLTGITVDEFTNVGEAPQQMSTGVGKINEMTLQIASATEEQSAVAEEVSANVSNIRDFTQRLAVDGQEMETVSLHLNKLAEHLEEKVGHFKV